MENFDFTTPIDATVIFEDSSDETDHSSASDVICLETETNNSNASETKNELCQENESNNKTSIPETNHIKSAIRNYLYKTEKQESIKTKRLDPTLQECVVIDDTPNTEVQNKEKKQPSLDMPLLFDDNTTFQDGIDHSVISYTQNVNAQTKPDDQKKNKRKKSMSNQKKTKKRLCKGTDSISVSDKTNSINNNEKSTKIQQNTVPVDKSTLETLPKAQKCQNQTNDKFQDNEIPVNIIQNNHHQQQNTGSSQSKNAIHKTISNYLGELLNAVSENMISIINSYQTYTRLNKINVERSLVEHAKNNYIRTKYHFFDLSYSSVLNIIIPREKDISFVTDFINSTIALARSKSYPYTYVLMEPLYLEMIDWIKKRESQIQSMNLNSPTNSMYDRNLCQNSNLRLSQKCLAQQQNLPDKDFSTDGFNSSVTSGNTMNIGSTNLKNQFGYPLNKQKRSSVINPPLITQESSKPPLSNTQTQQKTASGLYTHVRSLLNKPNIIQHTNLNVISNNIKSPGENHVNHQSCSNFEWNQEPNKQLLPNFNVLSNVAAPWQSQPTLPSAISQDHQEPNKQLLPPTNKVLNNEPLWQNQGTMTQRFSQIYQEPQLPQNNQDLYHEIVNPIDLNRSSISRDSGFISPPGFNSCTDNMQCTVHEDHSSGPTPLISHVTSLNPKVSYLAEGDCAVCGKITKTKCLGCYNCYYCSQACQYLDWKKHMGVCK